MDDAITNWAHHLHRQADVTAATITLYVRAIRHFTAWLADQARGCDPAGITPGDVRDYRTVLLDRRRAPATINRILTGRARGAGALFIREGYRRQRGSE
jgi:site-specific recombinase XerD